jgi:fructoselysine 6-phosphate deglycase
MATEFNPKSFIQSLQPCVQALPEAERLGRMLATRIDRIYFVSCGAPNRIMLGLQYWIEHFSASLEVRRYFPAEFMQAEPPRLDERTLVILASKSGTTRESVEAAQYFTTRPCITVGVTQDADLPLARHVQHSLLMGHTNDAYFACFMLLQALIGAILAERDHWPLQDKLMASLAVLPDVLAQAAVDTEQRGAVEARHYKDDRVLYALGSGPMFTAAYVLGVCILAESQWMHVLPVEAAEFFHGPFESIDETTPIMLFLGEDPSRPQMERALAFCRRYSERLMVYDSKDFPMPGIATEIRPLVAPYVIGLASERMAAHLAVWHKQPLTQRRYMWKTEY